MGPFFSADLCEPAQTRHYLTCTNFVTLFIVCDTFYRMAKPACVGVLCDLAHTRIIQLLRDEKELVCHVPPFIIIIVINIIIIVIIVLQDCQNQLVEVLKGWQEQVQTPRRQKKN